MFFSLLLVAIAVVVGIPALTGKGKLLSTETVKKEKTAIYKKWIRIIYAALAVIVLLMAFFNFVEKVAYVQEHYYEFTEEYPGADGVTHAAGERHNVSEMREILNPTETSGSLCAPTDTESLPYRYVETTYTLDERYAFVGFLPYQTAHILSFVTLGLSMVVILTLFIFINRLTDKEAQKKTAQAKNSPVRPSMPRGAFDFSDYEDEVEVAADFADEPQEIPSKKQK